MSLALHLAYSLLKASTALLLPIPIPTASQAGQSLGKRPDSLSQATAGTPFQRTAMVSCPHSGAYSTGRKGLRQKWIIPPPPCLVPEHAEARADTVNWPKAREVTKAQAVGKCSAHPCESRTDRASILRFKFQPTTHSLGTKYQPGRGLWFTEALVYWLGLLDTFLSYGRKTAHPLQMRTGSPRAHTASETHSIHPSPMQPAGAVDKAHGCLCADCPAALLKGSE